MTSALLLCRLQRLEDVRRLSHRADVPLNQKVDESRDHGGYFRVLLRVVREQPFMCRVVAQLSHRVPDRHLVSWQFQIFNSVVKVLPFAAEVIDQPFKGYAQQCACSPWRRARKDRLQQIIDLRTANRLPTIVTTNLVAADFDAAGAERIASRFNQVLYPIKCTWSDFRKRSALKNLKPEEVF